ncbi:MAG: PAS domain-containing protein [Pirellulales bacterium]|nr:PAS domain-containing protein [Pirellulales bacterium]
MRRRRLIWQFFISFLLVTIGSLLAAGWFASNSFYQFHLAEVNNQLHTQCLLLRAQLAPGFSADNRAGLQAACQAFADATRSRVTLILPNGDVLCDTQQDPRTMANHADRPEFKRAMGSGEGTATRLSATVGERLLYCAVPITRDGQPVAVVRTSLSLQRILQGVRDMQLRIAGAGLGILLLAASLCWYLTRRFAQPLEEIRRGAERFARGELNYKLLVPQTAELADVAEALNQMAAQLEDRIRTISRQGHEQQAMLASMVEGVLAVDPAQRLITLNRAAAELLSCDLRESPGRSLQEVVRSAELRQFVAEALQGRRPLETDVVLPGEEGRVLQAHGTALRDAANGAVGAVIVLNDVTQLRKLENLRRDFVANVSHELRTPITSIKGFVETLLDGAIDNREDAVRFLEIVARQADRLNAIIEDLLSLSKIEQGAEDIVRGETPLRPILESAMLVCATKASERSIEVKLQCPDDLTALANAPLLEQAVVNLLDNAIKYSDPTSEVQIRADQRNGEVTIAVADRGCGIEADHLPRLWERFYRVDKARSRKLGGTGLGLSIVKHIVNAHHGRVTVESQPGTGSTFVIRLPT